MNAPLLKTTQGSSVSSVKARQKVPTEAEALVLLLAGDKIGLRWVTSIAIHVPAATSSAIRNAVVKRDCRS
jgi:hypothetical protein